jgi:hypothetical protein
VQAQKAQLLHRFLDASTNPTKAMQELSPNAVNGMEPEWQQVRGGPRAASRRLASWLAGWARTWEDRCMVAACSSVSDLAGAVPAIGSVPKVLLPRTC